MIDEILEINARLKTKHYPKKRLAYQKIFSKKGKPFVGIVGMKGIGKTVMLIQALQTLPKALYLSFDMMEIKDLYKIVEHFYNLGYRTFLLDEIHYYRKWKQDLKKLYELLDIEVFFTSSVSIELYKGGVDLSRRVLLYELPPFTFREYIYFELDELVKPLRLEEFERPEVFFPYLEYDRWLESYIKGKVLPYLWESGERSTLTTLLSHILEHDLPIYGDLPPSAVEEIKELFSFMGKAHVEDISYSSLSKNLGITKYKVKAYVELLEKAFVVHRIEPKGTNIKKEPKIVFNLPFRILFNQEIGYLREDFFVSSLRYLHYALYYLKNKRGKKLPDYYVPPNYYFEIGGRGKSLAQMKDMKGKKYILVHPASLEGNKRPLSAIGFLAGFADAENLFRGPTNRKEDKA